MAIGKLGTLSGSSTKSSSTKGGGAKPVSQGLPDDIYKPVSNKPAGNMPGVTMEYGPALSGEGVGSAASPPPGSALAPPTIAGSQQNAGAVGRAAAVGSLGAAVRPRPVATPDVYQPVGGLPGVQNPLAENKGEPVFGNRPVPQGLPPGIYEPIGNKSPLIPGVTAETPWDTDAGPVYPPTTRPQPTPIPGGFPPMPQPSGGGGGGAARPTALAADAPMEQPSMDPYLMSIIARTQGTMQPGVGYERQVNPVYNEQVGGLANAARAIGPYDVVPIAQLGR